MESIATVRVGKESVSSGYGQGYTLTLWRPYLLQENTAFVITLIVSL